MSHAIIKGANGRRHEVDFGDGPVEVSVHVTDLDVEIVVESPDRDYPPGRRRFSVLNLPREQFASAFKEITYRSADTVGSKTLRPVGDDA